MAEIKINNFSEIDFENVNPAADNFLLPNGKKYRFSDNVCHECWAGGTVLESIEKSPTFYCVLCNRELHWVSFKNDFVDPFEGTISFLLPKEYSSAELEEWLNDYKEQRKLQENFKDQILNFGKE